MPSSLLLIVDAELFRNILDIFLRVQGEEYIVPPSEEELLTFLIELGYKGQLNHLASILKFVRIGEDVQEYGRAIPDTIGKGFKGKKAAVTPKKKSSIFVDDNIIPKPDVSLKLGKSTSKTEAKIAEEARRVHDTHERLVIEKLASEEESDESEDEHANRPIKRRRSSDIMQAIKASRKISRSHPHTRGSSEGASITLEVPDESTCIFKTLSESTGITPGVLDEVKGSSEDKVYFAIDWGSENESDNSEEDKVNKEEITWLSTDEEVEKQDDDDDDRSIDLEETDDEHEYSVYKAHDDVYVREDEYVHDDADEEMKDAEDDETRNDDATKADAEKTK
ncbi:hypothetical protein Tco_0374658 [Tanacetum coccineum]